MAGAKLRLGSLSSWLSEFLALGREFFVFGH